MWGAAPTCVVAAAGGQILGELQRNETNPDATAASTKVHFDRMTLASDDIGELIAANGVVLQSFRELNTPGLWGDYLSGRVVKVRFVTRNRYEDWEFRINAIESQ